MSYVCKLCNTNPVQQFGQVCENCKDPFSGAYGSYDSQQTNSTGGSTRRVLVGSNLQNNSNNNSSYMVPTQSETNPQVISSNSGVVTNTANAASLPSTVSASTTTTISTNSTVSTNPNDNYLVEGIARNCREEAQKGFAIEKWFRSVFQGIPFSLDETVHIFQVYQSYTVNNTGTPICDEVRIYGKITSGHIYQDNVVRVWGKRDKSNAIVANKVLNIASGTYTSIQYGISASIIRLVTILLLGLILIPVFSSVLSGRWGELLVNVILIAAAVGLVVFIIKDFNSFARFVGGIIKGIFKMFFSIIKAIFGR